jgi:uncharacterized membrane protein YfcA
VTLSPQDVLTVAELAAVTFLLGLLVGFVGAGGAGFAVALLTTVFGLSVHTAIGTALAAMLFVTLSGSISHVREGNVARRLGLVVGLAGAAGAVLGADASQRVSEQALGIAAGLALWILAGLVWARSRLANIAVRQFEQSGKGGDTRSPREWLAGVGIGAAGGVAAAILGIGMAPFLQLGFLTVHHLPLHQTIGTTMLTLVFISASGGIAMARHGDVSVLHLVGLTLGLASGAFIGAKFTRRAPRLLLRVTVVAMPIVAGAMLLFL